jgi:hypothetical protein
MLYSSKKEINTLAEHGDLELDERGEQEEEVDRSVSNPGEVEQKKLDPLEGLDEPTRICFLVCSLVIIRMEHGLQRNGFSSAQPCSKLFGWVLVGHPWNPCYLGGYLFQDTLLFLRLLQMGLIP